MIDIRDIATFVIHCLEHPAPHFNRVYTLHGEEVFGFHEIASLMTLLLGKTIRYTNPSIPFFQMKMFKKDIRKATSMKSSCYTSRLVLDSRNERTVSSAR